MMIPKEETLDNIGLQHKYNEGTPWDNYYAIY